MPEIINVTGHEIDMLFCQDIDEDWCENTCRDNCPYGKVVTLQPHEIQISVKPVEEHHGYKKGVELVTLNWEPNKKSAKELNKLENELDKIDENFIIVGSVLSAQAFPERIYALIPVPGYERVPRHEKLVRSDKFTVFPKGDGSE